MNTLKGLLHLVQHIPQLAETVSDFIKLIEDLAPNDPGKLLIHDLANLMRAESAKKSDK